MKSFSFVGALLLPALLVLPASAQTASSPVIIGSPPVMDNVQFELAAEDWVETTTAKVTVTIDASLNGADAEKVRGAMQKAVSDLAGDAQWRFTNFDRATDQAGLETWHAELEARLKETSLGGLADKTKSTSKPGLQLKVDNIEFTPTLAEHETLEGKLRNQIYGAVNDELKRLAAAEPERKFRVSEINFSEGGGMMPRPMMRNVALGAMNAAMAPAPEAPVTVGQKLELKAHVTLSAVAPRE